MDIVSLRLLSKIFPRLFTDYSAMVGIGVSEIEKQNLFTTLPFSKTKNFDFSVLKDILAHPISFSSPFRMHLHPGTDSMATVQLSMKVHISGFQIPDLDLEPLRSGSSDFRVQL